VTHSPPALVGQVHPDQDVAGHPNAGDLLALAVLDLGDRLHRDLHVEDVRLHVQGAHPSLKVGLDPVLIAGIGVDDEPVTLLDAQPGAEGGLILDVFVGVHRRRIVNDCLSNIGVGDLHRGVANVDGDVSLFSHVDVLPALGGLVGGDLGGPLLGHADNPLPDS
jgi:hypothetical protein